MSNENYISYSTTQDFLSVRRYSSILITSNVALRILSPIVLLILINLTRLDILTWSINFATGIGVVVLLVFTTAAVVLFVVGNRRLKIHKNYEYKGCNFSNNAREKTIKENKIYESQHMIFKIIGTTFCILSVIPSTSGALSVDVLTSGRLDGLMTGFSSAMSLLVGIGAFSLVKTNVIHDSFNIILQLDDRTGEKEVGKKLTRKYTAIYWMIVSFIYPVYSFLSNSWNQSWIIWPLAGIAYGIFEVVMSLKKKKAVSKWFIAKETLVFGRRFCYTLNIKISIYRRVMRSTVSTRNQLILDCR